MGKSKILAKAKANHTRPAEIDGEPVLVRVYPTAQLKELVGKMKGGKDEEVAAILADQFLDETGQLVYTAEWFMSDECVNAYFNEVAALFIDVNYGTYKKK